MFIDTHTHIYSAQFDSDRNESISYAINNNVKKMLLPAIDKSHHDSLLQCIRDFPDNCFPMTGLHPTSVKENYKDEIEFINSEIINNRYVAIGECGLDYYWDKTFIKEQEIALRTQIELSVKYKLPLVLHSRNSLNELIGIISGYEKENISGVFHCFPGEIHDAEKVIDMGFMLGIGGIVTYKNSAMATVVKEISLDNIILETDAPYLSPVPYRGKRNESSYIRLIANKIAEIKNVSSKEVEEKTTKNALKLFNLPF